MQRDQFHAHFHDSLAALDAWQGTWGDFSSDETVQVTPETVSNVLRQLNERLTDNYPFFHARYAGQMMKPPHPVAVLAYATAMQINPNNHALDGGMATSAMEKEVVADLAQMFGYPEHLGHLTASGTIANLEALWVARCVHPDRIIVASDQAHYTHSRMCAVIGVPFEAIPSDGRGRMDLDALESVLRTGTVGTVVATAGTTGLGSVDPIHEIIPLAQRYGARVHVDAAYGGFFTVLAQDEQPLIPAEPFRAIAASDSVVVDPHKHGLQPYGCGSVLFRDPVVGTFYKHDSPYTYFTSRELHLGEISLECSRAGASAAALWATLQCLPLSREGLGAVLAKGRQAALRWAAILKDSPDFCTVVDPELDILVFYPVPNGTERPTASSISALTDRVFQGAMDDPIEPVFLAKYVVQRELYASREDAITWDVPSMNVLRSVLMKPEHLDAVPMLHRTIQRQVEEAVASR